MDKNKEDSSNIEKDEISRETSEMKAKKTSLGGKSPRKLNTTEIKKRQVRKVESGKGILANLILFSIILGKFAIGKEIELMMVRNRIEKGNLPKPWCGGEFALENYMHADIETLRTNILP